MVLLNHLDGILEDAIQYKKVGKNSGKKDDEIAQASGEGELARSHNEKLGINYLTGAQQILGEINPVTSPIFSCPSGQVAPPTVFTGSPPRS